jgi:hypothetical protein
MSYRTDNLVSVIDFYLEAFITPCIYHAERVNWYLSDSCMQNCPSLCHLNTTFNKKNGIIGKLMKFSVKL